MNAGMDLYRDQPGPVRRLMANIYASAVRFRMSLHRNGLEKIQRLPARVISVGNLTVGGTGKTPAVMMIARFLRDRGVPVVILSRGYRGKSKAPVNVVSDGENILAGPVQSGDEPCLMAASLPGVPVITGSSRVVTGRFAIDHFKAEVLILDDGFQHVVLRRDLNLLLLDAEHPWGNGHLLPAGALREPVTEARRADAFILTRAGTGEPAVMESLKRDFPGRPVFTARHQPVRLKLLDTGETRPLEWLKGRRIAAFCGLARPETFHETLTGLGADPVLFLKWPDHFTPQPGDLKALEVRARTFSVHDAVTTAKDAVKLTGRDTGGLRIWILEIEMDFFDRRAEFESLVLRAVERGLAS